MEEAQREIQEREAQERRAQQEMQAKLEAARQAERQRLAEMETQAKNRNEEQDEEEALMATFDQCSASTARPVISGIDLKSFTATEPPQSQQPPSRSPDQL